MSERHPIIAITGSSGAGTTSVTRTFENIFRRENVSAAVIEGDSFHRYDRAEMKRAAAEIARIKAGPDAAGWNDLDRAMLRATDELATNHFVTDASWAALAPLGALLDRHVRPRLVAD